mmetsp:Transcript_14143/g.30242  ORF Transcript_14143/g.30242 Transcript_14143/m.30242 type:complete len:358 (-) Transcript_14143:188-1261(-)
MRRLHQMEHLPNVRHDRSRHGNVAVGMVRHGVIRTPPRTPSGQALVQSQPVPVCIGCASQDLARLDVDVEEYRVVIGLGILSSGAEDAAQRRDVLYLAFLGDIDGTTRLSDYPKGTQWSIRREMLIDPFPILDPFLNDPITPIRSIFVKVNTQTTLLVAVLNDNGGSIEVRRYRHPALRTLLQKGPFVLHLIPRWNIVQQRVHTRNTTIEPPVTKPIVRCQQAYRVLLRNARFTTRFHPQMQGGDGAHDGTRGAHESECQWSIPYEETQWDAGAGYGDVGEVIDNVFLEGILTVVGFVIEVECGGEGVEVHSSVLVEEGGLGEGINGPRGAADGRGVGGVGGWTQVRWHCARCIRRW